MLCGVGPSFHLLSSSADDVSEEPGDGSCRQRTSDEGRLKSVELMDSVGQCTVVNRCTVPLLSSLMMMSV